MKLSVTLDRDEDGIWVIFRHYRELVRPADAEKWFAVAPARVEAAKAHRESGAKGKTVKLPKLVAA